MFRLWETCFGALFLGWLGLCLRRVFFAPLSKLPGPIYTLVTDFLLMYHEFTGNRRLYIHELHKTFGPVVRIGPNEASFTSPEALREIYQSGGDGYDKTEFYNLFRQFGVKTTFSSLGKAEHIQKRRQIAAPYAKTNIFNPKHLAGLENRAMAFLKRCEEAGAAAMDIYIYLHCFALDSATYHLLHPYGTKSIEGRDLNLMKEMSFFSDRPRKLARYRWPTVLSCVDSIFKSKIGSKTGEYMIRACKIPASWEFSLLYKLQKDGVLQQHEIAAECMNHLAAGIDTTGDVLCFLMHHLSLSKSYEVQNRLIEELTLNKGKALDDLTFLDAVIKEGLRCFPPVPMSQPRYVPLGGRKIDGYSLPAKTIVSCQAWSLHRLNKEVFIRGDEFSPERWVDAEPQALLEMNKLLFSFSAGGRGCTGKYLALAEMKCLLRAVYSRYRTRISPEMKGRMTLSDQAITTRPLDQTCMLMFEPIA